jgi:hypothetical protein
LLLLVILVLPSLLPRWARQFDAGNHSAKKRVAAEVVRVAVGDWGSRFLKRRDEGSPWRVMTEQEAVLKSAQIMRDYRRPDREARLRESEEGRHNKRRYPRDSATPMEGVAFAEVPLEPAVENPFGVHDHDVLMGRGAYVNGNTGNHRLRVLALQRKAQFDRGNFTEKRALAAEIVTIIRSLDPPGRFLQRAAARGARGGVAAAVAAAADDHDPAAAAGWEELSDERAIHKVRRRRRGVAGARAAPERAVFSARAARKSRAPPLNCASHPPRLASSFALCPSPLARRPPPDRRAR